MKQLLRKLLGIDSRNQSSDDLKFRHYKTFDTEGAGYFCEFEYPNSSQDNLEVQIDSLGLYSSPDNPPGYFVFSRDKQGQENGLYIRINEDKVDLAIFSGSNGNMQPDGLSIEKLEIPTDALSLDIKLSNLTRKHDLGDGRSGIEQRLVCEVMSGGKVIYNKSTALFGPLNFTSSLVKCVSSKGKVFHN